MCGSVAFNIDHAMPGQQTGMMLSTLLFVFFLHVVSGSSNKTADVELLAAATAPAPEQGGMSAGQVVGVIFGVAGGALVIFSIVYEIRRKIRITERKSERVRLHCDEKEEDGSLMTQESVVRKGDLRHVEESIERQLVSSEAKILQEHSVEKFRKEKRRVVTNGDKRSQDDQTTATTEEKSFTPDTVIGGVFTNEGGPLQDDDSGVELFVPAGSIPDQKQVQVSCSIYADMDNSEWNIPAGERMICPVVELSGSIHLHNVEIRLPHNITDPNIRNHIKTYHLDERTSDWIEIDPKDEDTNCEVGEDFVSVNTNLDSRYVCTCPDELLKDVGQMMALFFEYTEKDGNTQVLKIYVYIIEIIYDLTDCLKNLHGSLPETIRCLPLYNSVYSESPHHDDCLVTQLTMEDVTWVVTQPDSHEAPWTKIKNLGELCPSRDQPIGRLLGEYNLQRVGETSFVDNALLNLDLTLKTVTTGSDDDITEQTVCEYTERIEFK